MGKEQFFLDSMWPPTLSQVKAYFIAKQMNLREAEDFFAFYQLKQWRTTKGEMMKRWKTAAVGWIYFASRENQHDNKTLN